MTLRSGHAHAPPARVATPNRPDPQLFVEQHHPQPGPPRPLLGKLRRVARAMFDRSSWPRLRFLLYAIALAAVIGLGMWGFHRLRLSSDDYRLSWWQSMYDSVKLLALDWGPAAGVGRGYEPNWQLIVALGLAVLLIARAAWALVGARVRAWVTGHWLRDHVIICGAGVHGTALARELANDCDVVIIDVDPQASGLREQAGVHEWRVSGDATQAPVLEAAGVAKAAWVVAITGNDVVNSQIVATVAALGALKQRNKELLLLVQVEDPSLARFLEEGIEEEIEQELDDGGEADGAQTPATSPSQPSVVSFSTNAIAADWLLDHLGSEQQEIETMEQPHVILAGDHPLIDAVILAAIRRWRAKVLHELAASERPGLALVGGSVVPPLRISVYGPEAVRRVDRVEHRMLPEAQVLQLEAKDTIAGETTVEDDEWLRQRRGADQAITACWEEFEGITLTLGMARALEAQVPLTRVTALLTSQLDEHIKMHTANVEVHQLATLGCSRQAMGRISKHERLIDALERLGLEKSQAWKQANDALEDGHQPVIRTDSVWRVTPSELALVQPLVDPVPVSALVRARLAVDLNSAEVLHMAANRLAPALAAPGRAEGLSAFAAWCEFVRCARSQRDKDREVVRRELPRSTGHEIPDEILRLALASLGERSAVDARSVTANPLLGARKVLILAGGAKEMAPHTVRAMSEILRRALSGFDGVLLSGGTPVGLPGVVGRLAGELDLRAVGYLPKGRPHGEGYADFRETPGSTEFTVLEPLAMWADIFAAGLDTGSVKFVACPGGPLTNAEVLLARALGAPVAWLDPSAELSLPLEDVLPLGAEGILELPADAMTVRAFLHRTRAPDDVRERIARLIHSQYRIAQGRANRKAADDPALEPWDRLTPSLKQSDFAQADDIPNKLGLVGKRLAEGGGPLDLTEEQVELLAEVEHGRYNVERLTAGWRRGDRHIRRMISPHLKPWVDLSDDVQEYDREAVRNIGLALEDTGWGVADID